MENTNPSTPKNKSILNLLSTINPSVYLFLATILAIIVANSANTAEFYFNWLQTPIDFSIGNFSPFRVHGQPMTISLFVNDALMAIFFFTIGLEIKYELRAGSLSNPRNALLPVIAACGGMFIPVAVFLLVDHDPLHIHGAAIPMATDIAFSLAVLGLLGKKVPSTLKVFLVALAVADDIGGILVIAIFYTSHIDYGALIAAALVILFAFYIGRFNIRRQWVYYLLFFIAWVFMLRSGVHATIAGVAMGLAIPHMPLRKKSELQASLVGLNHELEEAKNAQGDKHFFLSNPLVNTMKGAQRNIETTISLTQLMHNELTPFVNYVVLTLFAFVNAGVTFDAMTPGEMTGIPLAITLGLLIGKPLGIFGATYLACKAKLCKLPAGMTTENLFGVSIFGGIGFTVALFIATLAYAPHVVGPIGPELLNEAKLGVFAGSILSGTLGYFVLKAILHKEKKHGKGAFSPEYLAYTEAQENN